MKQTDSNYQFSKECNYNLFECSCALACPAGGASGRAWIFFVTFFASRQRK